MADFVSCLLMFFLSVSLSLRKIAKSLFLSLSLSLSLTHTHTHTHDTTSSPPPISMIIVQYGLGSIRITQWDIVANSNVDFTFEVCYTRIGGSEVCPGSGLPRTIVEYVVTSGLEIGVTFRVRARSVK